MTKEQKKERLKTVWEEFSFDEIIDDGFDLNKCGDDETRELLIKNEIKRKEEVEKYLEETKYITERCEKNNPCPNCKINKKNHWDDIHYNCEDNHNMQCQILKGYQIKVEGMYKEYKDSKNK